MIIIPPSYEILTDLDETAVKMQKLIELAGRTCYKSEERITDDSYKSFVNMICNTHKHHSVIEHASITVKFIVNRGFTHELVRHRIASYSQESTRYCNYSKGKFNSSITCIDPQYYVPDLTTEQRQILIQSFINAEKSYFEALEKGVKPEIAREILPTGLKTEIISTMNLRAWLHVLKERTSNNAHPHIRTTMRELHEDFKKAMPIIFHD